MNNKKIGGLLVVFSLVLGGFLFTQISGTTSRYTEMCTPNQQCVQLGSALNWSHFAVGIIFSILSLGAYMIFFGRTEDILIERFEKDTLAKKEEEKFGLISKALDENEIKIIRTIRENPGITQNTLKIKTDLSKAKVSHVLSDFERKKLVYRQPKGKTYSVFLAE
ncbi:MAG: winged helix-turn-helix transcriptional regulator [Nanoarchaeota archaeon]